MSPAVHSNKDLALLGSLLIKQLPEVAADLLSQVQSSFIPPRVTDLSVLPPLFARFCHIHNVDAATLLCTNYNRQAIHAKQLFIGAILSLYHPGAFVEPSLLRMDQIGIVYKLAELLKSDQGNVSKIVHTIIFNYKVYDSFRQEVVDVTEKLYTHGKDPKSENN